MRRLAGLIPWGVVLIGVAGSLLALHGRGEEAFSYEQSSSLGLKPQTVLSAAQVATVVAHAPEPVSPVRRTPLAQIRCRPGADGTLRNPWSCEIRYRSGTLAHYRVTVQPDGRYRGVGSGIISGCCVETPTGG